MRNPFRSWNRRKTYLAAGGAVGGVIVGTAAFAIAAALTVTTTNIVAGSDDIVNCDADGFTAALGSPSWDSATGAYVVSDVVISGLDVTAAGCAGQELIVDIVNSSGGSLAQVTHSIVEDTEPGTLAIGSNIDAASIDTVAAAIYESGA